MVYRPQHYAASDACKIEPAVYSAVVESAAWLGALDSTHTHIRTWFDDGEMTHPLAGCNLRVGGLGSAITAVSFVPYVTRPFPMPAVDAVPAADVQALADHEAMLAIVTGASANVDRWHQRFERSGLTVHEVARHSAHVLESEFSVHVWKIEQRSPTGLSFGAPIISLTNQTPQELNVYGSPKGGLTNDGDRVVFTPTDARDHVAYPFVKLPVLASDSWARVVVESPAPDSPSCQLIVQSQDFTALSTVGCSSGTHMLRVPMSAQAIRVYLADGTQHAFTLPVKIELALAEQPQ
jgi:hypothetical protein